MFRSLLLSCSLLGVLVGGAVMAMDDENSISKTITVKTKNMSPGKLVPFNFEKIFLLDIQKLIVQQLVFEECLENKNPVNLALVCKKWREIVKKETEVNNPGWKAWHGVIGHEDIYQTFLNGKLVYRPDPQSDEGMVTLSLSALKNPLEGTFDLSKCGDTGEGLSIATGYRKGRKSENAEKVEVWLAPQFLIKKKVSATAKHFNPIMKAWDAKTAPIGMFFTWGAWDNLGWYDYLTTESMEEVGSEDLLKKYQKAGMLRRTGRLESGMSRTSKISHFVFELK